MKSAVEKKNIDFVLFGSTGDLSTRKILPALEKIVQEYKNFKINIFAIGRRLYTNKEYIEHVNNSKKFSNKLLKKIKYIKADISKSDSLSVLKKYLKNETIYFFATHSEFYENITLQLKKFKLIKNNTKAIFEKPFGNDCESSKKLDDILHRAFLEKQIYRIDHYLGKETVQNIMVLRFANSVFEPLWNDKYISNIQIIIDEDLGIESRGQYYDKTGAIKDMIQNHVLQLVSLLIMPCPKKFSAKEMHESKLEVLKSLDDVNDFVVGQYEGYKSEKHVQNNSRTETFCALKLKTKLEHFKNTPIFLRTGKKLEKKRSIIVVEFKKDNFLFPNLEQNRLILNIQPKQDIIFEFNTKKPNTELDIKKAHLKFCHDCHFKENSPEGYEKLILDTINGDQTLFIKSQELIESWRIVDNLTNKINKNNIKPFEYKQYKTPKKSIDFIKSFGFEWLV